MIKMKSVRTLLEPPSVVRKRHEFFNKIKLPFLICSNDFAVGYQQCGYQFNNFKYGSPSWTIASTCSFARPYVCETDLGKRPFLPTDDSHSPSNRLSHNERVTGESARHGFRHFIQIFAMSCDHVVLKFCKRASVFLNLHCH
jgi:hypothetical protein